MSLSLFFAYVLFWGPTCSPKLKVQLLAQRRSERQVSGFRVSGFRVSGFRVSGFRDSGLGV